MIRINYIADSFPPEFASVNGRRDLIVDWPLLVWSALTVGRANFRNVLRHGQYSLFELIYRVAMIYANLKVTTSGRMVQTEAYREGLDPSEKAAVSFFLGLTTAKAFVDVALDVPWMMHLDVYRQQLQPILRGRSRPDLVGRTRAGEWVAIESKGRTNGFQQRALSSAKQQVQMLDRVCGTVPVVWAGIVAHFGGGELQLRVSDPPTKHPDSFDIDIPRSEFFEAYYGLFLHLLANQRSNEVVLHSRTYLVVDIPLVDLRIGIRTDLVKNPGSAEPADPVKGEHSWVGSDGILVTLGETWTPDSMQKEPEERHQPR